MFKVTDPGGGVHYCDGYIFLGDNISLDNGAKIIAGKQIQFTIVDLSAPVSDPTEWLIDIGPFFDRFGIAKMGVLTSTDPVVQAIVKDVMTRKWVDLKRTDVEAGIDALVSKGIPNLDAALKDDILTMPVADEEKSALKKLYFS